MNLSLKTRREGTLAQQRALEIHFIAMRILREKRVKAATNGR